MICLPCVPGLAAMQRSIAFNDQPGIWHVYADIIVYGQTHSLKRARRTHEKIRIRKPSLLTPVKRVVPPRSGWTKSFHVLRRDHHV